MSGTAGIPAPSGRGGRQAGGGRSPVVYVHLCPACAGYAPATGEGYLGPLSGRCQGCGVNSREVHRFRALILSAVAGGCACTAEHPRVTGDLPSEEAVRAVWLEIRRRPAQPGTEESRGG